jgi:tetratricopeptide (TPR) repeat protein
MIRTLVMSAVCVLAFSVGCSAQQPTTTTSPPTDNKSIPSPVSAGEPKATKAPVITSQAMTRQVLAEAEKAVEADPKSADAYRQRGEAHYFLGLLKEAERDLSQAVELDGSDDEARYSLCRTLRASGKSDQADNVADALKKRNPNYQMPLELLGDQKMLQEATPVDELAWHTWHRREPGDASDAMTKNPTLAVKRAFAAAVRPDAGETKRKRLAQQIASLGDVAQDGYERLNKLVAALENKYLSIIDDSVDKAVAQNPFVDRDTLTRELFPIVADRVRYCQELKVWIAGAAKTVDEKPTAEKPQPKLKAKPADLPAPDEGVRKRTDQILADTNAQLKENPKDYGAWQLRAVMRYHRGEFDDALADLDRAIRLAPERIARTMIPDRIRILAAADRTTELKEVEGRFLQESPIAGAYLVHGTDGKKLRTVMRSCCPTWMPAGSGCS